MAPADAHREAPGARRISTVVHVSSVTSALVWSGALTVHTRILTKRIRADASTGVGIDRESRLAGTRIRCDALAVWAAVVPAERSRVGGRHGDASTGIGIDAVSCYTGAAIVADADAVSSAVEYAIVRS